MTRPLFNEAAIISLLASVSLPATHVDGVISFLRGKDMTMLQARLPAASPHNTVTITMDNKQVVLQAGVHFFLPSTTPVINTTTAPPPVVQPPVPVSVPVAVSVSTPPPATTAASSTSATGVAAKVGAKGPSPKAAASASKKAEKAKK